MGLFHFDHKDLEEGLNYLGFHLKPNDYQIKDWNLLIAKVECRINTWQQTWISRAGRLVLIKSILEAIPVYWMALAGIPKGVIARIQQIFM